MAFRFRETLNNDVTAIARDFPLDPTYATTAKRGDVVRLNASGNVVQATTSDTNVLGVLVGFNHEGYINPTKKVAKVIVRPDAVFEADVVGGTPTVGTAYGIDGSTNVDVADTTTTIVKCVRKVTKADGSVGYYFTITSRQIS